MREVSRIDRIIAKLKNISCYYPQESFFIIVFSILNQRVFFYIEDDILEKMLNEYHERIDPNALGDINIKKSTLDVIDLISKIWHKVPDWRFEQLLCNIFVSIEYSTEYYKDMNDSDVLNILEDFYTEEIIDRNRIAHKCEDYELMQFTGLIDKNITMIYEGDILRVDNMEVVVKYGEFFDHNSGNTFIGFYLEPNNMTAVSIDKNSRAVISIGKLIKPGKNCSKICEVIGNIYNNPELIKGE